MKIIFFILLFLRDLRGKNKIYLFWYLPVRLNPIGRRAGLTGLVVFKAVLGQIFIEFHGIAPVETCLAKIVFRVLNSG